ncbi:MAG: nitroreductase [Tractidigestivibacter sp.]|uniref:nitroreductase n=1 Tax=Tractidigestivibacter sp. TaxID=2847320 RepID=UPI002A8270D2|nr:nitroreductase [Tractidigestivibacter sp.]MDY4534259.1 nitroreductase [Tractidigestivibacter sp.]
MNEVEKCIRERRSTPRFKSDPVDRELIERVIEAGLWAPSGMGRQSPIIVAVTNRALRDELAEENRRIMGAPQGTDPFYGAPVVLAVLAGASAPTRVYDGSATIENMLLAAQSLGLGGHWIHRAKEEFEEPRFRGLLARLGVEGDFEGIGHVVVGYPDAEKPQPARKGGRVFWAE